MDEGIDVSSAGYRVLLWEELTGQIHPAEIDEVRRAIGPDLIDHNDVRPDGAQARLKDSSRCTVPEL